MNAWPGAIWYSPVVCQSRESFSISLSSADGQQGVANGYRIADLDIDRADHARLERADVGFHLHGFQHHDEVALLHLLTWLHQHLEDVAGQRCRLRITTARRHWCCRRCRCGVAQLLDTGDVTAISDLDHEILAVDRNGIDFRLAWLGAGRCRFLAGRYGFEGRRVAAVLQELQADLREQ